jgi:hypothetical protein
MYWRSGRCHQDCGKESKLKKMEATVYYSPKAKSDFQKIIDDISGDKEDATS